MDSKGKDVLGCVNDVGQDTIGKSNYVNKRTLSQYLVELAADNLQANIVARLYTISLTPVECLKAYLTLIEYRDECRNQTLRKQYGLDK